MEPTSRSDPEPAERLDGLLDGTPYRALGHLGQGGMGAVVLAEHRTLLKRVVVKVLHPQLSSDPRFGDRMRVEAQALAALASPHVVSVSDLGQTPGGRPYLVMEWLEGRTMREELRARGAIPVAEAIGFVRQVLAGLAAAHRLGIIHRDVKLDNVFLCAAPPGGAPLVKVLDFGIAKVLQRAGALGPVPARQYPTEEGILVGSPRTLSPEQAKCQTVDARSDIYAVGLMAYTLIVGEGPFWHAKDMLDLLNAHLMQAPTPPSRVAQQRVPPDLDRAILRALAKRPDDRFQTAEAFSDELARIASVLTDAVHPSRTAPRPAAPATADESEAATLEWPASPTAVTRQGQAPAGGLRPAADPAAARGPGGAPLTALPPNLAPPPPQPRGYEAREFVLLTVLSTVAFALIAVVLFRYFGYPGGH